MHKCKKMIQRKKLKCVKNENKVSPYKVSGYHGVNRCMDIVI